MVRVVYRFLGLMNGRGWKFLMLTLFSPENQVVIDHKIPPHLARCVTKHNESNQIHNVSERSRNKVYVSGTTLNNF